MEKVQWNSIDKKQNGLKYSKNDKSSTLPRQAKMDGTGPKKTKRHHMMNLLQDNR